MPKKLQLKLMSNSGELLNVINCFAGQVTVFRATAQGDLRPYQRALCGSQGKERFSVVVDGAEYRPEDHTLIGFGEPAPHAGLSVRQFMAKQGVPDGSVNGLLMSYGLEGTAEQQCASLTPDEERRLRLVAATCQPQRIMILNEPFDPVSSQWRERMAELVVNHARSRDAIVVVTSLSYRPECWIDNEAVSRVQVGETVQRTIGFGQSGSASNAIMNQLKDLIRDEAKVQEIMQQHSQPSSHGGAVAATAMAASSVAVDVSDLGGEIDGFDQAVSGSATPGLDALFAKLGLSGLSSLAWLGIAGTALLIVGGAAFVSRSFSGGSNTSTQPVKTEVAHVQPQQPRPDPLAALVNQREPKSPPADVPPVTNAKAPLQEPAKIAVPPNEPPPPRFVLDEYPEAIRTSLLDTTHGVMGDAVAREAHEAAQESAKKPQAAGGNLFKLLENASNTQSAPASNEPSAEPDATGPSNWSPPPPPVGMGGGEEEPSNEQARREAIRQKFLEAIRAAAERRQSAMDNGEE